MVLFIEMGTNQYKLSPQKEGEVALAHSVGVTENYISRGWGVGTTTTRIIAKRSVKRGGTLADLVGFYMQTPPSRKLNNRIHFYLAYNN